MHGKGACACRGGAGHVWHMTWGACMAGGACVGGGMCGT